MTPANYGKDPSHQRAVPLETGDQLHRWRVERGLTAKRLGELIEVTERSIHRAERGGRLGARIRVGMKLLQARIASGEITFPAEKQVVERIRRRKDRSSVVRELRFSGLQSRITSTGPSVIVLTSCFVIERSSTVLE